MAKVNTKAVMPKNTTTNSEMIVPGQEVPIQGPGTPVQNTGFSPANQQNAGPNQGGNSPAMTNWIGTGNSAAKARINSTHLMGGESLADKFGASGWDEASVRKKLNNATNRQFARDRNAYRQSHDQMMQDIQSAGS